MKREFLEGLGLDKETIDRIMAEHGKTIQNIKQEQEAFEQLKNEKEQLEQQLQQLNDKITAQEKELSSVEELRSKLKAYELENLKIKIANQAGIPLDLASRLNGETEEEIKADAEKLASFVNQKPTLPLKPTEPQNVDPKEQAYSKLLENLV
ncbi:DUF4355 domain-containing protein [Caldibacillus debilis]|uniref:phage scaffolding protein n=1 Tax=Caldibacillus debilis TaxID=301148 RepID=UPI000E3A7710|nr:DUF4355 domain-containing protein [Caldibacillus debilis]REJ29278.1 MAG: hypothetical protein C6W56_06005 [Caldibacillus debilis]